MNKGWCNTITRRVSQGQGHTKTRSASFEVRFSVFSPARAQSAEADGARARNRTSSVEPDYEQEHKHEKAGEYGLEHRVNSI